VLRSLRRDGDQARQGPPGPPGRDPRLRRAAPAGARDELRAADALEARTRAGDADDLDPTLASGTPNAEAWRGLETLGIYLEARRALLFERFIALWRELEREGFAARLRFAITERPRLITPCSPDGNRMDGAAPVGSPPLQDDG
jgi:hypothetical protein